MTSRPSDTDGAGDARESFWNLASGKAWEATSSAGNVLGGAATRARRSISGLQAALVDAYDRRGQHVAGALESVDVAKAATSEYAAGMRLSATTILGKTYQNRELIRGAANGWAQGTGDAFRDVAAHIGHQEALRRQIEFVEAQGKLYGSIERHLRAKVFSAPTKETLLDSTVVGGETLAHYIHVGTVPTQIQQAFELAYPRLSLDESFLDAVKHSDVSRLGGLVSGVKGKLFELRYLDDLNNGLLPEGYHAELAASATQPGWDIAIYADGDGSMVDALQLKATSSVAYVQHALERYPNIDVVTTSEVHSHLMMMDAAQNVFDGHITNQAITAAVEGGIDQAVGSMHWTPSVVSLAVIAYSAYNAEGLTNFQKSEHFGERSAKSYIAYLVGSAAALASGAGLVGIAAGIGTRMLIGSGQTKRETLDALRKLGDENGRVLRRLTERMQVDEEPQPTLAVDSSTNRTRKSPCA